MTVTEIATEINGLSASDSSVFNANCEVKIHRVSSATPSDEIKDLIDEVEGLSGSDFSQLQGLLSNNRKLSQRPC